MHEGWQYVAAAYALSAFTLGVWFAMIVPKLRRGRPGRAPASRSDRAGAAAAERVRRER